VFLSEIAMSIKNLLIPTLNQPPPYDRLPELPAGTSIPRILHQTFYTRDLPPRLRENVERLRAMNPGWEYRFYDDDGIADFIQEHYPPLVWEAYERIDPRYGAARADLFRYLLIYKVGGVYLDIKSGATRPFDDVLHSGDRFVLSKWQTADGAFSTWGEQYDLRHVEGGEFQQWHVIGAPGHPFLKAVLEQVLENLELYDPHLHQTGKRGVLRVTGPTAYTLAIERVRTQHPHRALAGHDELGLEYNVYPTDGHVKAFKGHYSLQTASLVRLNPLKRTLSHAYGLAQLAHDRLNRLRSPGAKS
jgi:mannosyltransferase OCH1-like enzyme